MKSTKFNHTFVDIGDDDGDDGDNSDHTDVDFVFVRGQDEMKTADQYFSYRLGSIDSNNSVAHSKTRIVQHVIERAGESVPMSSQTTTTTTPTTTTPAVLSPKAIATLGIGHRLPMRSKSYTPLLPPTYNSLDAADRTALIRSSRKLEKVLGATPQVLEHSAHGEEAPRKLIRRTTVAHITPSVPPLTASHSLSRSKTKTLRVTPSSGPPIKVTTPHRAPLLQLAGVPPPPPHVSKHHFSDKSLLHSPTNSSVSLRSTASQRSHTSTATVTYEPDHLSRQQGRARLAKLARMMGENVPAELMMNQTARPLVPRSQQSPISRTIPTYRRLSVDLPASPLENSYMSRPISASSVSYVPDALKQKIIFTSKSLWKRKGKESINEFEAEGNLETPTIQRPLRSASFSLSHEAGSTWLGKRSKQEPTLASLEESLIPLTEKQKSLNVKRALKMAQIFGAPPPQTFLQMTNPPNAITSDTTSPINDTRMYAHSKDRTSKQSLASLAYMLDHDCDSLYDLLSNTPDSDPEADAEPLDWPYERSIGRPSGERKSFAISRESPSTSSPLPRSNSFTSAHKTRRETSAIATPAQVSTIGANPSESPMPFSAYPFHLSDTTGASIPSPQERFLRIAGISTSKPPKLRKEAEKASLNDIFVPMVISNDKKGPNRRRRASKLSRFFGVGYHDLFSSMMHFGEGSNSSLRSVATPTLAHSMPASPRYSTPIPVSRTSSIHGRSSREDSRSLLSVRPSLDGSRPHSRERSGSREPSKGTPPLHPRSSSREGGRSLSSYVVPGAGGVPPLPPRSPARSTVRIPSSDNTTTAPLPTKHLSSLDPLNAPTASSSPQSLHSRTKSTKSLAGTSRSANVPQLDSGTAVTILGSGGFQSNPDVRWNESAHEDIQDVLHRLRHIR